MLIAAGHQGFTRLSIKQLGWETNTRLTQLHAYIRELVDAGVLERQAHSGRVNTWIIPEVRALALKRETPSAGRMTIFKSTFKENVQEPKPKANVVSFQPPEQLKPEPTQTDPRSVPAKQTNAPSRLLSTEPPSRVITPHETQDNVSKPKTRGKPIPHYLIAEILNLTNDKKSFGLWYKFVSKCDEQTVYRCLDCLRNEIARGELDHRWNINHRGKYLTGIIKKICPELLQGQPSNYQPPPTIKRVTHEPQVTKPAIEPIQKYTPEMEAHGRKIMAEMRAKWGWTDLVAKPIGR